MTMASYYGSLAATRCLGTRDVPVIVADADRFAPARWSRHAFQHEDCPPVRPIDAFIDWLLAFGARQPGNVLYATCDDLAWVFAERQAELRKSFRLLSPPFESVARVLDKAALHAACTEAGLLAPRTWFPCGDDLHSIAKEAKFPLIIKPRTQVRFRSMCKGRIVASRDDLVGAYRQFYADNDYDADLLAKHPDLKRPMIQELYGDGRVYAISGFADICFSGRAGLASESRSRMFLSTKGLRPASVGFARSPASSASSRPNSWGRQPTTPASSISIRGFSGRWGLMLPEGSPRRTSFI